MFVDWLVFIVCLINVPLAQFRIQISLPNCIMSQYFSDFTLCNNMVIKVSFLGSFVGDFREGFGNRPSGTRADFQMSYVSFFPHPCGGFPDYFSRFDIRWYYCFCFF